MLNGAAAVTAHLPDAGSYRPAAGPAVVPSGSWPPNTNSRLPVHTLAARTPTGTGAGAMRRHRPSAGSNAAPSPGAACPAQPPISSSSLPVQATTGPWRLPSGRAASTDQRPRASPAAAAAAGFACLPLPGVAPAEAADGPERP